MVTRSGSAPVAPAADVLVEFQQPGAPPLLVVVRDRLVVGRDTEGLLLRDPKVSRRHAELRADRDGLVLRDLGSTNGTFVNGERLRSEAVVRPGDQVLVGATGMTVVGSVRISTLADSASARVTGTPVGSASAPPANAPRPLSGSGAHAAVARTHEQSSIRRLAAAASVDERSMGRLVEQGSTVTILFSDIESSTEHATRLGDVEWFRVLAGHDRRVRRVVARHGGVVVKTQGDGYMVSFASATQAVLCAIHLQREISDATSEEHALALRVRIGVHTGEALRLGDDDWIGRHVIIASRIADQADGGQVLVSALVWELTRARSELPYGEPTEVVLKGLGPQSVLAVAWWDYEEV